MCFIEFQEPDNVKISINRIHDIEIKIRNTQVSQLHPYPQVIKDIPNILKDL